MDFLLNIISGAGYIGIAFLMLLASAAVPLPSEIIMTFSGFLAGQGRLSLLGVIIAGSIGSFFGSILLYYIGHFGGRALVLKYGKFLLMSESDLEKTEKYFEKYGNTANLVGRLVPVIRTFISFPAGLARMEIKNFILFALLGSIIWSSVLAYAGEILGAHWTEINKAFHSLNIFVGVVLVALAGWYVYKHLFKKSGRSKKSNHSAK